MSARWLLLVPTIPPGAEHVRAAIGRRLDRAGAIALRSGVYVLPANDGAQEDFQWIRRELEAAGGGATLLEATVVDGLDEAALRGLFATARNTDYAPLLDDARAILASLPDGDVEPARLAVEADLARLRTRLEEVAAIDFFGTERREEIERVLGAIRARLPPPVVGDVGREKWIGRVWCTRVHIAVDRMASGWLVRRFVDPDARFRWVPARGFVPGSDEVRFDMFDAEFTHEGDLCTFEVLRLRMGLAQDPALEALAEIVHDLDIKDGRYARAEAAGVGRACGGIARLCGDDDDGRLERAASLFDALYASFG